jgi:hypothetical protein
MRPLRAGGVSFSDLSAIARIRRRIATDESIPLHSKEALFANCDQLYSGVNNVITERTLKVRPQERGKGSQVKRGGSKRKGKSIAAESTP